MYLGSTPMFCFGKKCKLNSLLLAKRFFGVLIAVVAGLNFCLREANADVCFLPSMNGGECGMSMKT